MNHNQHQLLSEFIALAIAIGYQTMALDKS